MTITKSGNIASFYTVGKAPIKHLRVYFSSKQAGEGDPSPTNIREISGWNGLEVYYTGKNLINDTKKKVVNNKIVMVGQETGIGTYSIKLKSGHYRITANTSQESLLYNHSVSSNTKLGYTNNGSIPMILYGSPQCEFFINNNNGIQPSDIYNVQLEVGDIATPYEPYRGETHSLDWSSTLGTIYGGYVDLVTGEVVQEWLCVDLNNLNWQYNSNWNMPNIKYADDFKNMNIIKATNNQTQYGELVAERYSVENYNALDADLAPGYIIFANTARLFASVASQDDEIQGLACFKLLNPITYQLSPTQLTTLIGQNNIWSNADRVEVEYDMMESNDELYRRRNTIIRSYPHIETTSGGIASFNTDLAAPLKECKIYFNPVQAGSGTPSPSNVRLISGWNEIKYTNLTNEGIVRDQFFDTTTIGLKMYIDNNVYPFHTRITGKATSTSGILIIATNENVIGPCYIYGVPSFNSSEYSKWCYGMFNNYSDANNNGSWVTDIPDGTCVQSDGTKQVRLYLRTNAKSEYDLDFYPNIVTTPPIIITLPQTFYGGYIDLVNGELVQTHIKVTNVTVSSLVQHPILKHKQWNIASLPAEGIKTVEENKNNYYCNLFQSGLDTEEGYVNLGGNTTGTAICIRPYAAQTDVITNVTDATAWLAQNNFEMVYPLNTPIHHQLTPQQIKSLKGQNNIWSNTNGDISVKYWTH